MSEDECFITPNLVPRFYRPLEIFFGCTYNTKVDLWSLGCMLYELFTGEVLFAGKSNNETVKMILLMKGKPTSKFLLKGEYIDLYFRNKGLGNFITVEKDLITEKDIVKELAIQHENTNELLNKLKNHVKVKGEILDESRLLEFKDFIDKCLALDPFKRVSAVEALLHPFVSLIS